MFRLISFILVLSTASASGQSIASSNERHRPIIKDSCEGIVFTMYEESASFKIPKEAFEDSLTLYLKANNAFDTSDKFIVHFLLTKHSKILDVRSMGRSIPGTSFMKGFLHFSQLWQPAKQNKRAVCAYVSCLVEVKQDKVSITIFPQQNTRPVRTPDIYKTI
jgi:hypothetical protein